GQNQNRADAPAVLSQLPLKLHGTIVHGNPNKSVATVFLNNRSESRSYQVGDSIDNIATVTKIERRKVTFRNTSNNRMEYLEIPEDAKITFGARTPPKSGSGDGEVDRRGDFDYVVKRSTLD